MTNKDLTVLEKIKSMDQKLDRLCEGIDINNTLVLKRLKKLEEETQIVNKALLEHFEEHEKIEDKQRKIEMLIWLILTIIVVIILSLLSMYVYLHSKGIL